MRQQSEIPGIPFKLKYSSLLHSAAVCAGMLRLMMEAT